MDLTKVWNFITSTAIPIIVDFLLICLFIKIRKMKKKTKESDLEKFLDTCNSDNVAKVNDYLDQERKNGSLYKHWKELYEEDYTSLFAAMAVSIAIMAFAASIFGVSATVDKPVQESTAIASTQESTAIASTQENITESKKENLWEKRVIYWEFFVEHIWDFGYLFILISSLCIGTCDIMLLALLPAELEERMAKIRVAKAVLNVYIEKGSVSELFNKTEIRGKEGFHLSFENTPNRTYEINIKDSLVRPEGDGKEKAAENKVDSINEPKKDTKTEDPKMEPEGKKKKDTKKQETSKEK